MEYLWFVPVLCLIICLDGLSARKRFCLLIPSGHRMSGMRDVQDECGKTMAILPEVTDIEDLLLLNQQLRGHLNSGPQRIWLGHEFSQHLGWTDSCGDSNSFLNEKLKDSVKNCSDCCVFAQLDREIPEVGLENCARQFWPVCLIKSFWQTGYICNSHEEFNDHFRQLRSSGIIRNSTWHPLNSTHVQPVASTGTRLVTLIFVTVAAFILIVILFSTIYYILKPNISS